MRVAIGSDHAGYELKEEIKDFLKGEGVEFVDVGTEKANSCDYPEYAEKAAALVRDGRCDRGILVCGTGIGMAISANKVPGIRAVVANDVYTAKISREHNDTNLLALGARVIDKAKAEEIIKVWLSTPFLGGRHKRRVDKISEIEGRYLKS